MIENVRQDSERALLVGVARDCRNRNEIEDSLDELSRLVSTAGGIEIGRRIQVRPSPDPKFYIGKGLVAELKEYLGENGANGNCVIFDDSLSPGQQRNLEQELESKVIDRSVLILDIFAKGARTAESRLQVELAQLEYTMPRLTGAWVHFSKQYGGIGSKGPGETQLEIDRRQIRKRIDWLKDKLRKLDTQRTVQRKKRQPLFKVALVGYTNAGKSTLFNALTRANVQTADKLFTTLDSTTRAMSVGYPCQVIFSDTVGFIKKLPHQLVESFKSTLEEVAVADLLLHVVDCSDPHRDATIAQTRQVLSEIGASQVPYLMVYNKSDLCTDFEFPLESRSTPSFLISAANKTGLNALQAELVARAGKVKTALWQPPVSEQVQHPKPGRS